MSVFDFTISIICCIGISLNGIVIWLLGFQIKRNPITVLILNLAIADFGYLVFLVIFCIYSFIVLIPTRISLLIILGLCDIMYINGVFILTAISIDRCVCVLFPIWHRFSRPKYLSSVVCAFLWMFSFLFGGIQITMQNEFKYDIWWDLHLVITSVLCLPLITTSTLILFVKICLKPKQIKHVRLLVMILITLLCFLILNLPLNIYGLYALYIYITKSSYNFHLPAYLPLCASLNSSVNPIIYYLVGRKKGTETRESIKVVFQRVFKEDEDPESTEKATNSVSTPV